MKNTDLLAAFTHPGAEFRGAPFWAWNGKLETQRLKEQVDAFKTGGFGGFFMHSRCGLQTPYLSEEWFEAIRVCLTEAERIGLAPWLYDEDRWPSGTAGGLVTKEHPEFRQHALHFLVCKNGAVPANTPPFLHLPFAIDEMISERIWEDEAVIAIYLAKIKDETATDVRPLERGLLARPGEGESLILCLDLPDDPSDWHNGGTYLDTLNAEATRAFLARTHESYREHFGDRFGKLVPGIFTDEPSYKWGVYDDPWKSEKGEEPVHHRIAWTKKLPDLFQDIAGYDLLEHLPDLIFDVEDSDYPQTRYWFHEALTRLFVNNFMGEIGRWCAENGLESTGHVLGEDTPAYQTCTVGSCMRCYEEMERPGIDQLAENWQAYASAKQLSSAARQFGKKWRLSETYGGTGWDFPFAGYKALGDYQIALGVNFFVPHLSWLTMEGEAKRDYPGPIFHQASWWPHFHHVEDYFARVLSVMTRGEEIRDLLVIHPNETLWTLCRSYWLWKGPAARYDHDFFQLTNALLANHLDFDYGDEEILSRIADVSEGPDGAPRLIVGKASYRAIVLPSIRTLRPTTIDLLARFREKGGLVVFHGELPDLVNGARDERARDFAKTCPRIPNTDKLIDALSPATRRVSIRDAKTRKEFRSALYLLREDDDNLYLFLCNTGEPIDRLIPGKEAAMPRFSHPLWERSASAEAIDLTIVTGTVSSAFELEPETGDAHLVRAIRDGRGRQSLKTSLAPLQSRLFVFSKKKVPDGVKGMAPQANRRTYPDPLDDVFERTLSEPNVLVLDQPSYRIGDGEWKSAKEILRIDKEVRRSIGLPSRSSRGSQPWATPSPSRSASSNVSLRYTFDVGSIPKGDLFLAIEAPERFTLSVNGTNIPTSPDKGWWVDESLRRIGIPTNRIVKGRNELTLETCYDATYAGLEIVYLLGAFDVTLPEGHAPLLIEPSTQIRIGDWCRQGLPFYAGNVGYTFPFYHFGRGKRIFLDIPSYRGAALRLLVDGKEKAFFLHPPCKVELTKMCPDEKTHRITIEILGHRRNSHGPLHWTDRHPDIVGPGHFQCDPSFWSDAYQLVPCGLLVPPIAEFEL